jgi:hypothetical protein
LREVPEREPVRAQLVLERGTEHAGLDARRATGAIDFEHAVETAEIDRHGTLKGVGGRHLDTADHARSAAVRNRREARRRAPVEDGRDLLLVGRKRHDIGWIGEVAREPAHHVAKRLPVGVSGAVGGRGRAEPRQRRRRRDARRPERDVVEPRRRPDLRDRDPEPRREQHRDPSLLLGVRTGVLEAPAPELPPTFLHGRGDQSTRSAGNPTSVPVAEHEARRRPP